MRAHLQRACALGAVLCLAAQVRAAEIEPVAVEFQPLAAQVRRLVQALDELGAPLDAAEKAALAAARDAKQIQRVLDGHALLVVDINPEQRVTVRAGPAAPVLDEDGWRTELVKVVNQAGTTAPLNVESPNARPIHSRPKERAGALEPVTGIGLTEVADRWIDLSLFEREPFQKQLSGLAVEYRLLDVYCGDRHLGETTSAPALVPTAAGRPFKRDAAISFQLGSATQEPGSGNEAHVLFSCRPAVDVALRVRDHDGQPVMAGLTLRDARGRVYPAQAKRLAPDFFFQTQVYRRDGESVKLPPGSYSVEYGRGPEYLRKTARLEVPVDPARPVVLGLALERWVNPAASGWISGDHHIHAAGCSHYDQPTEGVFPEDLWRHLLGEDLHVGSALTWGPCYDFQKQFFEARPNRLSTDTHVLRYDLEVSGFGSQRSGHLVLLRLKEQEYPGVKSLEDWPTLGLTILEWAKKQGAVVGPAHSGWGLTYEGSELPSYTVPAYDGIGANEYIVQVTHEVPGPDGKVVPAVDFMSAVDQPYTAELNMWYHTLNAGFRTRLSGETDFPCIYSDRVGVGRVYVKAGRDDGKQKLDFDRWVDALAAGQSYVSDGRSHLLDFNVGGVELGTGNSELALTEPGSVRVTARVAARLDETPRPEIQALSPNRQPYWHLERARIADTREVPVEIVVNGYPVARKRIVADGRLRSVRFDGIRIDRSSWVALRILASSHTNPIFVVVAGKPIRASRRSIEWALKGVDACWAQKEQFYKPEEHAKAVSAYEHARQVYRQRLQEAEVD